MLHSAEIDKIAGALAKAQAAFTNPPRNREVTVRSDKGTYTFAYATFDAILDSVRKPLTENGISYAQTVEFDDAGKPRVVTTLMHESGQWLASRLPIVFDGEKRNNQAFGSALTYAKRYGLTAILGVAADEDDDANGADGNGIERKTDRAPAKQPTVKTAAPAAVPPAPQRTARQWADDAIKTVKAMRTPEEIGGWQAANKADLDKLEGKASAEYTRLIDAINERLDALRPQAAE